MDSAKDSRYRQTGLGGKGERTGRDSKPPPLTPEKEEEKEEFCNSRLESESEITSTPPEETQWLTSLNDGFCCGLRFAPCPEHAVDSQSPSRQAHYGRRSGRDQPDSKVLPAPSEYREL